MRAWAFYNEFAMWCLLAFCGSGVYLVADRAGALVVGMGVARVRFGDARALDVVQLTMYKIIRNLHLLRRRSAPFLSCTASARCRSATQPGST